MMNITGYQCFNQNSKWLLLSISVLSHSRWVPIRPDKPLRVNIHLICSSVKESFIKTMIITMGMAANTWSKLKTITSPSPPEPPPSPDPPQFSAHQLHQPASRKQNTLQTACLIWSKSKIQGYLSIVFGSIGNSASKLVLGLSLQQRKIWVGWHLFGLNWNNNCDGSQNTRKANTSMEGCYWDAATPMIWASPSGTLWSPSCTFLTTSLWSSWKFLISSAVNISHIWHMTHMKNIHGDQLCEE